MLNLGAWNKQKTDLLTVTQSFTFTIFTHSYKWNVKGWPGYDRVVQERGFGWVDKAQCFRSARQNGAAGSSPDFSRVFSWYLVSFSWHLSRIIFSCTTMSYHSYECLKLRTFNSESRSKAPYLACSSKHLKNYDKANSLQATRPVWLLRAKKDNAQTIRFLCSLSNGWRTCKCIHISKPLTVWMGAWHITGRLSRGVHPIHRRQRKGSDRAYDRQRVVLDHRVHSTIGWRADCWKDCSRNRCTKKTLHASCEQLRAILTNYTYGNLLLWTKKSHHGDASCAIEESAGGFCCGASMREVAAVASRVRSRFRSWIKHRDSSI